MKQSLIILIVIGVGIRLWCNAINQVKIATGDTVRINLRVQEDPQYFFGKAEIHGKGYLVVVPEGAGVEYGSRIKAVGKVVARVIGQRQVLEVSEYRSFLVIPPTAGLDIVLKNARMKAKSILNFALPGDMGPLAGGILLGGTEGMSKELVQAFKNTGLSHVMAASGYNVTVVAGWIMIGAVKLWGRRQAIWFGIVSIILYMMLAGMTTAVIRAGIMVVLTMIAGFWGKKSDAFWSLVLAVAGMLLVQPDWIGDIGFQLSTAATAGLIVVNIGDQKSALKADLMTAVVAQLATIPIILHHFGTLSLWAPLVNMAVIWTIPMIMEVVAIACVVGFMVKEVGMVIAWLATPLLWWMEWVVRNGSNIPGNGLSVGTISWWWVAGYYAVWVIGMRLWRRK